MNVARKRKEKDNTGEKETGGEPNKAIHPTFPLSPTEIEIIIHGSWDGKTFGPSERAPKTCITLGGEDMRKKVVNASFDPDLRSPDNRSLEINPESADDFTWLEPRAHRLHLVTPDGKVPESLTGEHWNAGKAGVKKVDGMGILLTRPFV